MKSTTINNINLDIGHRDAIKSINFLTMLAVCGLTATWYAPLGAAAMLPMLAVFFTLTTFGRRGVRENMQINGAKFSSIALYSMLPAVLIVAGIALLASIKDNKEGSFMKFLQNWCKFDTGTDFINLGLRLTGHHALLLIPLLCAAFLPMATLSEAVLSSAAIIVFSGSGSELIKKAKQNKDVAEGVLVLIISGLAITCLFMFGGVNPSLCYAIADFWALGGIAPVAVITGIAAAVLAYDYFIVYDDNMRSV